MSSEVDFRLKLVELADKVMHCPDCNSSPNGGLPQPGWVGNRYSPRSGLVVLLQNPAAAPKDYGSPREQSIQHLLRVFRDSPSKENYENLMQLIFADMVGKDLDGWPVGRRWAKWAHPVSKLISDREKLAWINVVKCRTPGEKRKDDPITRRVADHGATEHVQHELKILKPRAIIAIGKEAFSSLKMLQRLPPETALVDSLKLQGASNTKVEELRRKLLDAGVDVG